jgi:D-alanyl-lipoteichoic acid acyltransferase DltB (MBOAT superfamily)
MLFNTFEFIIVFLPIVVAGFFLIASVGNSRLALYWLVCSSLFFYSWWNPTLIFLLLASLIFNFRVGLALSRKPSRGLLFFGVGTNLLALGWFKYSGFFVELVNMLAGLAIPVPHIILPLAISFYTFQQIAYLVESHDGATKEDDFLSYCAFIAFFPQLIAGPIVHHREIIEQFKKPETYVANSLSIGLGISMFAIGLFKKVVLADNFSPIAASAFGAAAEGWAPPIEVAWAGMFAFSLQIYFDFSGYSDMAIGLALMFGIRLPFNFASPYKSASIIEFWSRWHITLTRFLTNYVYNPILTRLSRRRMAAGKPMLRRSAPSWNTFFVLLFAPTIITMALSGLWHGAGFQFLIWGLLHGLMLAINHAWRLFGNGLPLRERLRGNRLLRMFSVLLTFTAVSLALVFFKSADVDQAMNMFRGLLGLTARAEYEPGLFGGYAPPFLKRSDVPIFLVGFFIIWCLPNSQQWLGLIEGDREKAGRWAWVLAFFDGLRGWRPTMLHGFFIGAIMAAALIRAFGEAATEFLYFTF